MYYLRSPISGSTLFAERGELTIYVSGDRRAYENVLPVLKVLGNKISYVGPGEEARYLKLLINNNNSDNTSDSGRGPRNR